MSGRVGSITTPIITDGLVLNLDAANRASYPKTGTIWNDTINGNNGTLTNGPTFSEDGGGSIVFDGVNDYGTIQHDNNLNTGNNLSISLWVYPKQFHSEHTILIEKGVEFDNTNFRLKFRGLSTGIGEVVASGDGDYDIRFALGDINGYNNQRNIIAFGNLNNYLNQWNYMVGTYDGSVMKLYWNGEEKVSYTKSFNVLQPNDNITICGPGPFENNYYNGNIANIQIYNRALSSSEVLHNYNALKGRFGL